MKGPGKGKTNNPKGKPKGTLNKNTIEAQELFIKIMNNQVNRIGEALAGIEDNEKYLNVLSKLFQYYMPRKSDVTTDGKELSQLPTIVIKTNGS